MFERYIFTEGSCRNIWQQDQKIGFELQTLISYYRGIPLSMVYSVEVTVDDVAVPKETIRVSLDGQTWFTLLEMETVTTYKWEYGEPLIIQVLMEGGLKAGEHRVGLALSVWPSYYPMPAGGEVTRTVYISG